MPVTLRVQRVDHVQVQYLRCRLGVRYWEDATVNGEEDTDGSRIPLRSGDHWCPVIDLETGIVQDWPEGTTASVHYKVCDDGDYQFLAADRETVVSEQSGYVPRMISPDGDGDYLIWDIDVNGRIEGWKVQNVRDGGSQMVGIVRGR